MASPRVSIGIPVYNGENYLDDALWSLRRQTMSDLEIIISDNASTDRTEAICREHASADRRIRYVRNPRNLGAAANYNRVAGLARGTYFKWAPHDDTCASTFLERCVDVLDADPSIVVSYSWAEVIDPKGKRLRVDRSALPTDHAAPHVRFRSLILAHYKKHPCTPVFGLIRREALMKTDLIPPYVHGDRILLAQLSLRGRFVELPDPLLVRREHPNRHGYQTARRSLVDRFVGTGPKPDVTWYDASKKDSLVFPDWRRFVEYAQAVRTAPLSTRERVSCLLPLTYWPVVNAPFLARDLILAAHQQLRLSRSPHPA